MICTKIIKIIKVRVRVRVRVRVSSRAKK